MLRWLRLVGLPLLWAATAGLMVLDHVRDPYDSSRQGTAGYGHNAPDALALGLGMSFAALVVVAAILRLWSYERSWGRALAAFLLLIPWSAFSLMTTMHAGGIFALHFLWVLGLTALCGGLLVISATVVAVGGRR